jgi:hypothetical protein
VRNRRESAAADSRTVEMNSTVAEAPRPAREQKDGRSPGSRVSAACRLPDPSMGQISGIGQVLAAYSCGGSRGFVSARFSARCVPHSLIALSLERGHQTAVVHRYAATLSMEMHQPVMLDFSRVGSRWRRQRDPDGPRTTIVVSAVMDYKVPGNPLKSGHSSRGAVNFFARADVRRDSVGPVADDPVPNSSPTR